MSCLTTIVPSLVSFFIIMEMAESNVHSKLSFVRLDVIKAPARARLEEFLHSGFLSGLRNSFGLVLTETLSVAELVRLSYMQFSFIDSIVRIGG